MVNVDKSQIKISFDFSPKDYYLCHNEKDGYSLNYRIDRSYKGKEDDVGQARIFLTDEEAEVCRQNGFDEVI